MSQRHIELCESVIDWDRINHGNAWDRGREREMYKAHPPELLLALWECPRYRYEPGSAGNGPIKFCNGCQGDDANAVNEVRHSDGCPVRRGEELTSE